MWPVISSIWVGAVTGFITYAILTLVAVGGRLDNLEAQVTTLETISVVRPADTIPVVIRLPDDVLRWD